MIKTKEIEETTIRDSRIERNWKRNSYNERKKESLVLRASKISVLSKKKKKRDATEGR